jgi:hypothetical protein
MNDGAARHFAVRQVNPFEGVLQVVECSDARAYSADGRVWQIQVIAERPDHTWRSVDHAVPVRQFFNFGLWDLRDGLHQVPANPVLDIGAMSDAANRLVETLSGLTERLPFALADHFECWATDAAGEPLALLATTEDRALIGHLRVGEWQASRFTGQGLATPDREAAEHPTNNASMPRGHAGELERRVRDAGRQTTWFDRSDPDRPVRLDGLGEPLAEAACVFPSMGLKTDWPDRESRRLAADYIDWLAPWLLMLPGLGDDERRHLEHSACRRAVALSTVYPLLPRIMDRDAVEAARVEARLRRAAR